MPTTTSHAFRLYSATIYHRVFNDAAHHISLLQRGVARGLSLFEIASLMCRADVAADPLIDRSPLERAVLAAAHLATHAMHSVPTHVASRLRSGLLAACARLLLFRGHLHMLPVLQQGLPDLGLPPSALPDRSIGLQAASLPHTLARQLSTQPTFTACPPAVAAWWAARVAAASSRASRCTDTMSPHF